MSPTLREKLAEYDSLPDDALVSDAVRTMIENGETLTNRLGKRRPRGLYTVRQRGRVLRRWP